MVDIVIEKSNESFAQLHCDEEINHEINVDVLTLTATPIPRTLQMSMTGIRSLSLIETPPVDRYPVQTYVVEESPAIIKDAIYREMSRNGQVFILYNRLEFN